MTASMDSHLIFQSAQMFPKRDLICFVRRSFDATLCWVVCCRHSRACNDGVIARRHNAGERFSIAIGNRSLNLGSVLIRSTFYAIYANEKCIYQTYSSVLEIRLQFIPKYSLNLNKSQTPNNYLVKSLRKVFFFSKYCFCYFIPTSSHLVLQRKFIYF